MVSSEQRAVDRTPYYFTMKTTALPPPSAPHASTGAHSRSNSQSYFASKQTSTPLSSPRAPHSVGQPHAPKLSPGAHRGISQDARTPSPNYFGLTIEPSADPRESSLLPRENWSSPTSSVKSFGAAIPKQLPLDANPEFEAFRRQVDVNRGKLSFNLSGSHFNISTATAHTPLASMPSALQRPRPPRWHTHASDGSDGSLSRLPGLANGTIRARDSAGGKHHSEAESSRDSAYASADSKRNSEASLNPPITLGLGRHESPAQLEPSFPAPSQEQPDLPTTNQEERQPSPTSADRRAVLSPFPSLCSRQPSPDDLTPKPEAGDSIMISPGQLHEMLEEKDGADVLLLDLRVSPQYAQSRVNGALNLCIPTTLLKRATFNLQKLQHTFQSEEDQERFASWRTSSHLVVYDAHSSEKRDAVSAMNMIKKFANEGYSGSANILRGGFNAFAAAFPQLIDQTSGRSSPSLSLGATGSGTGIRPNAIAPVIGGVMLPKATSNPNPFFSNIRQNQDLRDGVGQMDLNVPAGLDSSRLPRWLGEAAEASDHGKKVSDKFLRIELTEQSRMRDAYSVNNSREHQGETKMHSDPTCRVQLSGIEQGGKNRYKDILPFEHARVKLQGRPEGSCDYVNASHIKAGKSHKRYIASQGPLPATFEDFWSVIWDQDVRVIVMLTAESEGGQLKCHPYWKGNDFGPIRLRVLSEKKVSLDIDKHRSDSSTGTVSNADSTGNSVDSTQPSLRKPSQAEAGRRRANTTTTIDSAASGASQGSSATDTPYVIVRKFALSHAAHPFSHIREVTQLHYPSWPDFGAPAQPSHLLALVELSNIMQRSSLPPDMPGPFSVSSSGGHRGERSGPASGKDYAVPLSWHDAPEPEEQARPMLVHCSAGCGRTGAFCTVDSVIDMLKRQRLRAVQRANKRIDDRERSIARQAEDHTRTKRQALGRDQDGDVSMGESVSPLVTFDASMGMLPTENGLPDEHGIDTSWLDDEGVDLIAQTVEDFRRQRLSMVQSLRQFVLCYETVIEWVWRLQDRGATGEAKGRNRSGSLAL